MGYSGSQKVIKLGAYGLMSDLSQNDLPPNALIRCENVQFKNGIIERAEEIADWMYANPSFQTPDFEDEKPIAVKRYYPEPRIERQIVVTDKGRVYKYVNGFTRIEITALGAAPELLSIDCMPVIVTGGNESQNEAKKVYIFSGNSPIQVIEGDGNTRRNLAIPSPDWSTTYPTFGLIYRNRLVCFGNKSNPHQQYFSAPDDQENFNPAEEGVLIQNIYPGENEGLVSALVYKGKLFSFKKPYGVYGFVDDDPNPTNWYYQKTSGTFGIASACSYFEATDDVYIFSNDGSLVSMTAAFRLGDVYNADILSALKTSDVFSSVIRSQYLYNSFAAFLPKRKIGIVAFPSYKSEDGFCDSLIYIDFNETTPRISWHKYNGVAVTAVDRYKDAYGDDHFLFAKLNFDDGDYVSGRMATYYPTYTSATPFRIQTPHLNFETEANKLFDGFELMFESTSVYPLAVDVYIDSKFSKTFLIQPYFGGVLGPSIFGTVKKFSNFLWKLGSGYLGGRGTRPKWNSLNGRGQTISFVVRDGETISEPYTGNANPDDFEGGIYPVKITGIRVYYRIAGQDHKSQDK
jgi:hypothetical protein